MRDHREGMDPTPTDITERIREVSKRITYQPHAVRRRKRATAVKPAARGKAAKILRSQR